MAETGEQTRRQNVWERMLTIDRRVIFLVLAVGVAIPFVVPLRQPVRPTRPVMGIYNLIESLPPGSHIIISADYDPGGKAELDPMCRVLLHHCFRKGIIPIGIAMGPAGVQMFQAQAEAVGQQYGKEEGTDWVNLGFKPGGALVVIVGMGRDVRSVYPSDHRGIPAAELPAMHGVRTFREVGLCITISAAALYETWVAFAQGRFNAKVAAGVTGVMAPDCYPYLQTGQLVGILGGVKGAAEYEELLNQPWLGKFYMGPQSIAHIIIIAFVLIGNVAVLASRRAQRRSS